MNGDGMPCFARMAYRSSSLVTLAGAWLTLPSGDVSVIPHA